jgi:Fe-S-cluster containining protein
MVKHNLGQRYFHGCQDCRDCCNGKLFSIGQVTFADFKKIIRLFPTAFDMESRKMIFFYSLVPLVGCHYFRNNECTLYEIADRPDTCMNFPFGIDHTHTIQYDPERCPNLNREPNDFPTLDEHGSINPRVMNEFFTEHQYVSAISNKDVILKEFVDLVFDSESLIPFPKFKTANDEIIDIKEIESNKNMMIVDVEKINKIIERNKQFAFHQFVEGHLLSLENLPQFGKRLLEQI